MSQGDSSTSSVDTARTMTGSGRQYGSAMAGYLKSGFTSGGIPAILGGIAFMSGIRALLAGRRKGGVVRLLVGALLLGGTIKWRRSRNRQPVDDIEMSARPETSLDVDESSEGGAVSTAGGGTTTELERDADHPADIGIDDSEIMEDEESIDPDAGSSSQEDDTESDESGQVADTGVMVEEFAEEGRDESDVHLHDADRLGEAAFDAQTQEVPAPQRAFNQGLLAHASEAFWGVRQDDGTVVVSLDFDAIQSNEDFEYLASSEIGEDARELPIPVAIRNHWDEEFGGGTAVSGGDSILFATNERLAEEGMLRVLPAEWFDDE